MSHKPYANPFETPNDSANTKAMTGKKLRISKILAAG
jgi:hypothetical protein